MGNTNCQAIDICVKWVCGETLALTTVYVGFLCIASLHDSRRERRLIHCLQAMRGAVLEIARHHALPVLDSQHLVVIAHQVPVVLYDVEGRDFVLADTHWCVARAGRLVDKAARTGYSVALKVAPLAADGVDNHLSGVVVTRQAHVSWRFA